MKEPTYDRGPVYNAESYIRWAQENKRRADRLAEAVMAYRVHLDEETYNEMVRAQLNYEEKP